MSSANPFDAATTLHGAGRLDDAVAAYDAILHGDPGHAGALHLSAVAQMQRGEVDDAVARIDRSLAIDPDVSDAWVNAGIIYARAGRPDEAARALERAVQIEPTLAEAWSNLASQRLALDDVVGAEQAARRARDLDRSVRPAFNLALALVAQGRHPEALAVLDPYSATATVAQPVDASVSGVRAQILIALGRRVDARRELEAAIVSTGDSMLLIEHARLAESLGDLEASLSDYHTLLDQDRGREAARELALSELVFQCKRFALWDGLPLLQAAFRERALKQAAAGLPTTLTPFSFLSDPSTRAEQRAVGEAHARVYPVAPACTRSVSTGKLRIGYLSADLHEHATGILAVGLFEQHDRERFEVIAYSTGPDDGTPLRRRLVAAFDRFVHAESGSAAKLAQRISDDGIDILVDLKGYTERAPTSVAALRPAPIVVSYLGYPGTMGAPFVDYLIGDRIVTPLADAQDYHETLVQLPHSYQINDDRRTIGDTPSRADLGLPDDAVVLCGFNASYKINAEVVDAWAAILRAAPSAVLWLLRWPLDCGTSARLSATFASRGVDASRIVFAATRPHAEYLALYRHADLFLDTWPYNAHTTASDALWVGCPIVTLRGETFAGRVAASLLHATRLTQGVTSDPINYVATASAWANDPARLEAIRRTLEDGRETAPLFDTRATTRAIEGAYVAMARQHAEGRRQPILVAADGRVSG